ncbi:hypothetical protein CRG98_025504 [Punica granatum]|uniref:Uncharacterized protein n=1 Tax=Punica granatum TaxID=22663 RepID=A0A2I0JCY5_PUNGR|nr:hypothetical protein CRG98_025504 [Punica granatum]
MSLGSPHPFARAHPLLLTVGVLSRAQKFFRSFFLLSHKRLSASTTATKSQPTISAPPALLAIGPILRPLLPAVAPSRLPALLDITPSCGLSYRLLLRPSFQLVP